MATGHTPLLALPAKCLQLPRTTDDTFVIRGPLALRYKRPISVVESTLPTSRTSGAGGGMGATGADGCDREQWGRHSTVISQDYNPNTHTLLQRSPRPTRRSRPLLRAVYAALPLPRPGVLGRKKFVHLQWACDVWPSSQMSFLPIGHIGLHGSFSPPPPRKALSMSHNRRRAGHWVYHKMPHHPLPPLNALK